MSAGDELAENITIHIPSPTLGGSIGLATIDAVTPSGITPTLGCTINSDGSIDCVIDYLDKDEAMVLKIPFILASCASPTPSINITYKFGCSPDLSCITAQTCTVNLQLADVTLFGEMTLPTSTISAHPCTPIDIHTQFYLTNIGQVSELKIYVTLPVGVVIDPTSLTFSATVLPGTGCTASTSSVALVPLLSYPVIPDVISSGFYTRVYTLDRSLTLTAFPYPCSNELLFNFNFKIGTCAPSTIYPIVDMTAKRYCDNSTDPPIHSTPILTREIDVIPDPGHSYCTPTVISYTKTSASCLGHFDGSITASVTGTGPFTYSWVWNTLPTPTPIGSPSASLPPLTGLTAGSYTLTVIDAYGCVTTKDITIDVSTNPIHLPTLNSYPYTTCDQSPTISNISLTTYSTTSGYSYSWTATNASPSSGSIGVVTGTFLIGLSFVDPTLPSTIVVRATDPGGCYDELVIVIPACCVWGNGPLPFDLISNQDLSAYPTTHPGAFTTIQNFRVNGLVTVNSSLILDHCNFYMEPNSEIVLTGTSTLTLNSCTFVACRDEMWKGFRLSSNTQLVGQRSTGSTDDTRIYDALAGITCYTGANYNLTNVQMNRNYIDIDVLASPLVAHTSNMTDCHLFSAAEIPVYCGAVVPPLDGTLFTPHLTEKTKIGVNVLNNNLLKIGLPGVMASPNTNYFEDMDYGVYALNSRLEVINNRFSKLSQLESTPGSGFYYAGDGIYFSANDATIGTSYLKNLHAQFNVYTKIPHACIYLYGSQVEGTIHDENMTAPFGVLSANLGITYGSISDACKYKPLHIFNNSIVYFNSGVQLENTKMIITDIYSNTLAGPLFDPLLPVTSYGIYISGVTAANDNPRFTIDNNSVNAGRKGIWVQTILAPTFVAPTCSPAYTFTRQIFRNYIYTVDPDVTDYAGITLSNATGINTSYNVIRGLSAFSLVGAPDNKGIFLAGAKSNPISCNMMNKLNKGLSLTGDCSMSQKLAGNIFDTLCYHIFGASGSTLGSQTSIGSPPGLFPANRMLTLATATPVGAINNSGSAFNFAAKTTPTYYYPPFKGGVTSGVTIGIVTTSPFTCTGTWPDPPASFVYMRMAAGGGESGIESTGKEFALSLKESIDAVVEEDEQGTKKIDEELLYAMLKTDTVLLENDTLNEFYESVKDEHTGQLNDIRESINAKEFEAADELLTILSSTNEAEEANKIVYGILNQVEQRENYVLTNEEIETLLDIAEHCPAKYGQAVFSARVLIRTQYGYENYYWDDQELCSTGVGYRRASLIDTAAISSDKGFIIYPNPASTELNFKVSGLNDCANNTKIEIRDILGNMVLSKEYDGFVSQGKINITILANGAYIIKYSCGNNEISRQSFVVNK